MAGKSRDAVVRVEMTSPLGSGRPVRVPESQVEAYTARGFLAAAPKAAPKKAAAKKSDN